MDGARRPGAVASETSESRFAALVNSHRFRNPIIGARFIMDHLPFVDFTGDGLEYYIKHPDNNKIPFSSLQNELVDPSYFTHTGKIQDDTVGALALDFKGNFGGCSLHGRDQ